MMHSLFSAIRHTLWAGLPVAALLLFAAAAPAQVLVKGKVVNGTDGKPVSGVMLTLLTFVGGMAPVEEAVSAADGTFAFKKALSTSSGQPMLGMVRAEYEGVPYSTLIRAAAAENLQVDVYTVDEKAPAPDNHIVILEPGESQLVVNETFMFINNSAPARAFRNAERGTLRFYIPPAAKDGIQVQTMGPQGMPLKSVAEPAGDENVYKIDFAIKPGENRVDITYMLPHSDGAGFTGRVLYDDLPTRIAAPQGVTLEGDDLTSLGTEPNTQATLFNGPATRDYEIAAIRGSGRLRPPEASGEGADGAGGGGGGVRVAPAPIAKEVYWLLALTAGILVVGFVYLFSSRPAVPATSASGKAAASKQPGRGRRQS